MPRRGSLQRKTKPVIVGIGEILWDLLPSGKTLGGAPANVAFHAQSLGGASKIVSAVGRDGLGREILRVLEAEGVSTDFVSVLDHHPTGTVKVKLDDEGVPKFTIAESVAWDFIPTSPRLRRLAARADAVCFGTLAQRSAISRRTIRDFLDATRPECLRVFDMNLRQRYYSEELLDELLRRTTVLKMNDVEFGILARLLALPDAETDGLIRLMKKYPLKLIAVTRGDKGSRLFCLEREISSPAIPVDVVDTVGAGDAFTAALVMGLLRGVPLFDINRWAVRIAAFVCSKPGAWPRIPESLSV